MAAQLVPIRLSVTAGDLYTLWAPRWRDAGDDWEAFLGKGDDLYAFTSVADLAGFVQSGAENDLSDHPAWKRLTAANAHKLMPADDRHADLVAVEDLLAEKPTEESVAALATALTVAASIGSVCELPPVTRFFNGNPSLGMVSGGMEQFSGRAGKKRWNIVGTVISRSWNDVLAAIDEVITTPEVDARASARAAAELEEPYEDDEELDVVAAAVGGSDSDSDDDVIADRAERMVLGGDANFWEHVGIDPVRVMSGEGTLYTLRCYLDEKPIFLGRNGRVSVFGSERALARYLADEHDHDLADLSTYDDIRTAATDGSLKVDVSDENVYVLNGLAEDIGEGPDALDRDQLALAVEFVRDVGDYSEDDVVDTMLAPDTALGRLVGYVLDPESGRRPGPPYAAAVKEWEALERFVESRLRRE
ncbi:MAG: primosomal protein [Mycobacterium sp.]